MAVQATPVTPPPAVEPSVLQQFIEAIGNFVSNYWGFLLFLLMGGVALYLFYIVRKSQKESEKTSYHKIRDKLEDLCAMQVNTKRLQKNPMIVLGLFGIISIIIWIMAIVIMGFTGLFIGGLFGFTLLIAGGAIYYFYAPFSKRDSIYLRYREEGIIKEKYVGSYGGEYYSSDGYLNLLVFKGKRNIIFNNKLIIRVPQSVKSFYDVERLEKEIEEKGDEGGEIQKRIDAIYGKFSSFLKDLVQFNENTIVINHAKSLDRFRFMYYPVFADELERIIDKGVHYYKGLKDLTVQEALFEFADVASQATIKSILINPKVQYKQATGEEALDDVDDDKD